jgi:hypothetical protein
MRVLDAAIAVVGAVGRSDVARRRIGCVPATKARSRMSRSGLIFFAALVAFCSAARIASAHPVGVSRGEYLERDGTVFVGVTFARRELSQAMPWSRNTDEGIASFEVHREEVGHWVIERLTVRAGERPCAGSFDGMRFDEDGIALALSYVCPVGAKEIEAEVRFAADLERGHQHLAEIVDAGERREVTATAAAPRMTLRGEAPQRSIDAFRFIRTGIEHILTGYDHLLFLLGLVLVGGPLESLAGAISAFTVGHSLTLGLAALGVYAPSPRIVEPCIALSIAYVGVENWFARDARGRWRISLPFGLVHGFGFAGALREISLPRADIPGALFGFNLGVELGQIGALAVLLPLVLAARSRAFWERVGLRVCTMTIAVAGVVWFVARVRGSS